MSLSLFLGIAGVTAASAAVLWWRRPSITHSWPRLRRANAAAREAHRLRTAWRHASVVAQLERACERTPSLTRRFAPTWSASQRPVLHWPLDTTLLTAATWRGAAARLTTTLLLTILRRLADDSGAPPLIHPQTRHDAPRYRAQLALHPSVLHYAGGDQPWAFLHACRLRGWQVTLDDQVPYAAAVISGRDGRRSTHRLRLADLSHADIQRVRLGDWTVEGLAEAVSHTSVSRRRRRRYPTP